MGIQRRGSQLLSTHKYTAGYGWSSREGKGNKYTMAGRLRSSRMSENVMEEVLKRGVVEMGDDMKGLLWKNKGVGTFHRKA